MPPRKKAAVVPDGFNLRLYVSGAPIDICSPVDREQFVKEMVEAINANAAKVEWSGWYTLKTVDGKIASIRVREIGVVVEL